LTKTKEEIEQRIKTHRFYTTKMIRAIRSNPQLSNSACIGLSIALNQIEELEWVLGIEHNYEALLKIEARDDIID